MRKFLIAGTTLSILCRAASACPSFLPLGNALPELVGQDRTRLATFRQDGKGWWEQIPMQLETLTKEGRLLEPEEEPSPGFAAKLRSVTKNDRLVLDGRKFGQRYLGSGLLPCKTNRLFELESPTPGANYAYLAHCLDSNLSPSNQTIHFDPKANKIESPRYIYHFHPTNQLMFQQLWVKPKSFYNPIIAVSNADIAIHFDIKRFFTLDFDYEDVESYITSTRNGQLGLLENISFYLRLWFFKIHLQLDTTASFFTDSANIPLAIQAPVDARNWLHPGSGFIYSLQPVMAQFRESSIRNFPRAEPDIIKQGYEALAKLGLKWCQKNSCIYSLAGSIGNESFNVDMQVPRHVVAMGFFPMWIENIKRFKKELDWSFDEEPKGKPSQRIALFYDTSGLQAGTHKMDQWIKISGNAASCPKPIKISRVVEHRVHPIER